MGKDLVSELLSDFMRSHLQKKFSYWDPRKLDVVTLEFLKFFLLASKLPGYFIPLNEDADNIWHAFILETREYQSLCKKISPDFFLHHSGMLFPEYAASRSHLKLYEQDLTFITSYVENFGHFDDETIEYWPVASFIMRSMNWSMSRFHAFCEQLVQVSNKQKMSQTLEDQSREKQLS